MPKRIYPENRWDAELYVPLPGEPRNIGPLETLFQQLANRTEYLRQGLDDISGGMGGTTLAAHRTATVLDHPDRSVTREKLALGAVGPDELDAGAVTTDKLAPGAVTGAAIADGAIEARHLTPGAIAASMDFAERFVLTTRAATTSVGANTFYIAAYYAVYIPDGKRLVIKRWRRSMNATVPISWRMLVSPSGTVYMDAPGDYEADITPNYAFPDTGVMALVVIQLSNPSNNAAGLSANRMLWVELALEPI